MIFAFAFIFLFFFVLVGAIFTITQTIAESKCFLYRLNILVQFDYQDNDSKHHDDLG